MTCRDLSKSKVGSCYYVPLVDSNGGMVNDPLIYKLEDNIWRVCIADSDVLLYAKGIAGGKNLNVKIFEANIDTLADPIINGLPPGAGDMPGEDPVNGVYWNEGVNTRVQWIKAEQNWRFLFYYATNGDNRYQQQTVTASDTPNPSDWKDGTSWFDSGDGNLYVLYNDGNSRQWVITNPLSAYGEVATSP